MNPKFAEYLAKLQAQVHLVEHTREPVALLRATMRLLQAAQLMEFECIAQARSEGVSWSQVGMVYGVSKQGAQMRFDRMLRREDV